MARDFGRILSRIWDDKDFLALASGPQRLYCFLVTQANLNHAGLLPMTLRKWAKKAPDLTPEVVLRDLRALADARFVVVDEDSEEVLIRTFIRNDNVYKMPRVMGAAVSGALEIESHRLRRALLLEIDRIPLDELSAEPSKTKSGGPGPSIRRQVWGHIETLREAFKNLDPEPGDGVRYALPDSRDEGAREPLPEGVLEGVVLPPEEPLPEGVRGYAHARGGALARTSPAPSPTPAPTTPPAGGGEPPRLVVIDGDAEKLPETTDELIADWIDHIPNRPHSSIVARVGKSVKQMLGEGIQPVHIRAGIAAWARRGADPSSLPSFVNQAQNAVPRGSYGDQSDLGSEAHMQRFLARSAAREAGTA